MKYEIGKTYKALLNGKIRTFRVDEHDYEIGEHLIKWDDGDTEWAYIADMDRWVEDAKEVFEQ
ncbi:hypothetical protein H7B90_23740 [Cohnella xylanilytica]|uniref:Uncharacterized protein n=1 Tax=Cohnella xylanilytica TaxID=557555 RepID=A0A841U8I7_9BACL|nr:hypothetical protein [Cohnella xylanilytica]MBB6694414.1 hypothetical protein [Cohnella xylanilytica]